MAAPAPAPAPVSPKKKPVGTKTTETIIGTAAQKLTTAVKAIKEAAGIPEKLEESLTAYALKVTDYETRIEALETEYSQKKSEQSFQLQLDYKISQKEFADKYLATAAMTAVPADDYRKLQNEHFTLKNEFDQKVRAEVGREAGILRSKAESDAKLLTAEFATKEANNNARIAQLEDKLTFITEQGKLWKESLDAEREASIKRSANSAVNQTITTSGK